jgi:putative MATE family efflux protein
MLRSTEQVKLPVLSNLISVLVNIFLNAALIFGLWGFPKLGIRGAAIATVVAAFVNPVFILTVSLCKNYILRCSIKKMFTFPEGFVRKYFKISLPVFFNEAMWSLGVAGTNMVFGRMGESNIAALTIARTIENIAFVLIIGLCNACAVMIGKSIGKGDEDVAQTYAKRFSLLVPLVSIGIGSAIILFRAPILALFSISKEATVAAMWLLLIYSLEMPLRNIPYVSIIGIFRPGGDTVKGVVYDIAFLWGISLPLTILLGIVLKKPFLLVYLVMLLSEDIPKATLCLRYTLSGKWIHSVT